jgi:hypothetical protein
MIEGKDVAAEEQSETSGCACSSKGSASDCEESPAVLRTNSILTLGDHIGAWKVRWSIGRANYKVTPGLHALGCPGTDSPVLVSANYKLSFDVLRSSVPGIDAWLLVLDTRGINVWCAAGKGTFGTAELVNRIAATKLADVVTHREVVVPQLGAPGVAAHTVLKESGFRIRYGPVQAADLPEYLSAGKQATPAMRRVEFGLLERLKIAPVEFVGALRVAAIACAVVLILAGLGWDGFAFQRVLSVGIPSALFLLGTAFGAAFLAPALLPWLPGRPFALKGLWLGLAAAGAVWTISQASPALAPLTLGSIAWFFLLPALSSFIAMGYTGASTYTSLSGVLKEMRIAVPLQLAGLLVGVTLWFAGRFF